MPKIKMQLEIEIGEHIHFIFKDLEPATGKEGEDNAFNMTEHGMMIVKQGMVTKIFPKPDVVTMTEYEVEDVGDE